MKTPDLRMAIEAHLTAAHTRDEHALSLARYDGCDHVGIVERAPYVTHATYRWATAGEIRTLHPRLSVVEDGKNHALVIFPDEPTDEELDALRSAMGNVARNPLRDERRRKNGSK